MSIKSYVRQPGATIRKLRTAYGKARLLVDVLESDGSPAQAEARQRMYELLDQLREHDPDFHEAIEAYMEEDVRQFNEMLEHGVI